MASDLLDTAIQRTRTNVIHPSSGPVRRSESKDVKAVLPPGLQGLSSDSRSPQIYEAIASQLWGKGDEGRLKIYAEQTIDVPLPEDDTSLWEEGWFGGEPPLPPDEGSPLTL